MSTHGPALSAGESAGVTGIVLVGVALVLLAAFLFSAAAQRVRQPAVMGEIVAGIALGPSLLGLLPGDLPGLLFPPAARPYLEVLAQLGLVLFMFGVGYQLSLSHVKGVGRHIALVSFSSVALPFVMGATLAVLLYPWLDKSQLKTDGMLGPALFLGAAMSITAFPVLARIIIERGLQKHRVGAVALVSAAIQDVIAWTVLAAVVTVVSVSGLWSLGRTVVGAVAFGLVLVLVVRPALAWVLAPARPWAGNAPTVHVVLCSGLLASAWVTDEIGLHAVFGAFLFGAVAPRRHIDATAPEVPERIDQTSLLLLPVFFTVTGLSVDLAGLGAQGLVMVLATVAVACAGKFLGALGAARLSGSGGRESTVLGILLNARGLTELVVLNVGLSLGALDSRLFTAMVVMALLTTLMTGPLLSRFPLPVEPAPAPPLSAEPAPAPAPRPAKHARKDAAR
ncbi:cation/H(+) antiporter [Streptomyces violaceoruber]|uniref:Cation/H(+) antiporter n=1 Tax=Streptomyces violaceoruber TaxID=1935 RepID=A0A1V0UID9_STRVN|nr:cation:proton antiporter [Streptomyces violaceoruber]ARF64877.1 cation/H(+) antiporter [Streptomyces violaceoruber]